MVKLVLWANSKRIERKLVCPPPRTSACANLLTLPSEPMKLYLSALFLSSAVVFFVFPTPSRVKAAASSDVSTAIFGFRNPATESSIEARFLSVPDPKRAEEHLQILTQAPHMAGTAEDKATADYVARQFREAGFDTEIAEYNA